jgi:hypothetical protein
MVLGRFLNFIFCHPEVRPKIRFKTRLAKYRKGKVTKRYASQWCTTIGLSHISKRIKSTKMTFFLSKPIPKYKVTKIDSYV